MVSIVRAIAGVNGIPVGFPILLDGQMSIVEPAFSYLLELSTIPGRSHATETVRTYSEHLHDWFDTLEQSGVDSRLADEGTEAAYRNRMLSAPKSAYGSSLCPFDGQRSRPDGLPLLFMGVSARADRRPAVQLRRRVAAIGAPARHAGASG